MSELVLDGVGKVYPDGYRALSDLSIAISDSELLVLVGPSGCGKSTALRMIAGLEDITDGRISIGDRVVNRIPPRDRDVAMVFQSYALYPHLNVRDNIAFGLKLRKMPKAQIAERVDDAARILGLESHLDRKPRQLSGGQRQRVAMGRAIVRQPRCFLMDEPLSNLDAKLRVQMRAEIGYLQNELGVTTVYVTHDQTEAMTLGDRVAVMNAGVLQQIAAPQELYDYPVNIFVAGFIGSPAMNLLRARLEDGEDGLVLALGPDRLSVDRGVLTRRPGLKARLGTEITVGVRPEDMEDASLVEHPGRQTLTAPASLVEPMGSDVMAHIRISAGSVASDAGEMAAHDEYSTVVGRFHPRTVVTEGDDVQVWIDTQRLHWFAPDTGVAIWDE